MNFIELKMKEMPPLVDIKEETNETNQTPQEAQKPRRIKEFTVESGIEEKVVVLVIPCDNNHD